MLAAMWTSPDSAEVLFLAAAIVAAIFAVIEGLREPVYALMPAAVCLIAVGLLAA